MVQRRRGPGRPMKPTGPMLTPKSQIDIPDEVLDYWIKDILTKEELESLTTKTYELYRDAVKKAFFNVEAEQKNGGLINFGTDEYQDLAGVNLTISANPADWKDPKEYLKGQARDWLKAVFQFEDIEREIEARVLRQIMAGEAPDARFHTLLRSSHIGKVIPTSVVGGQILQSKPIIGTVTGRMETLAGAEGADGIRGYRELAESVNNWVGSSQVLPLREGGRKGVLNKMYEVLEKELAHDGGVWHNAAGKPLLTDATIALRVQHFANTNPQLKPLLETNNLVEGKLQKSFIGKRGLNFSLHDLVTHGVMPLPDTNLAFVRRRMLGEILSGNRDYLGNLQTYLLTNNNWQKLGFSSPHALTTVLDYAKGKKLGDLTGVGKDFAKSMVSFTRSTVPDLRDISRSDIAVARNLLFNLEEAVKSANDELTDAQEAVFSHHALDYVNAIAQELPAGVQADFKRRARRMCGIRNYVNTRSLMLAQEEFIGHIAKGNVFKTYFFLGKYSGILPKEVQELKKRIDNIPIGPYRVKDVLSFGEIVKNKVAWNLGIAGDGAYDSVPVLGQIARISPNHIYLYASEFIPGKNNATLKTLDATGALVNKKLDLFPSGETYINLRGKARTFRDVSTPLLQFDFPDILLFATAFKTLPDVMSAVDYMASQLDETSLVTLHHIFEEFYVNPALIDGHGIFAPIHGTPQFQTYKTALISIFDKFRDLKLESKGVDPNSFFSMVMMMKNRGFVKQLDDGTYILRSYMPALSGLASRLNALQSKLFDTAEYKIMRKTAFKLPVVGKALRRLWDMYNPGYGPLVGSTKWVNLHTEWLRIFHPRTYALLGKIVKPLKLILDKLFPSVVAGVSGGTAYLALFVFKLTRAFVSGIFGALKGDFKRVFREVGKVINDMFVGPVRFFGKTILKIVMYITIAVSVFVFFVVIFITGGGLLWQGDRPIGEGGSYNEDLPIIRQPDGRYCYYGVNIDGSDLSDYFVHPFPPDRITSCHGIRPPLPYHNGLDYGRTPLGTAIPFSVRPGTCGTVDRVNSNGSWGGGFGNHVRIRLDILGASYYAIYAHMNRVVVSAGQQVCAGDTLGGVGYTGYVRPVGPGGTHLHFEVRKDNPNSGAYAIDPCTFLGCGDRCPSIGDSEEVCWEP